jgi:uncharacterized protein DUF1461
LTERRNFKKVRRLFLFISFFYVTVYTPFAFAVYFPQWHQLNCGWNIRCNSMGEEVSSAGIGELNAFFFHSGELEFHQWTDKEKQHLTDVRKIADRIFVGAVFAAAIVILFFDRKQITLYTWINIAVILSFLAILPFFAYFWRHVFHPLLFENKLWLNTSNDFSYYLMPRVYFKATTAFIIGTSCIINVFVWFIIRIGFGKGSRKHD